MIQEHPDDVEAWIELAGILEESETVVGGAGVGLGWVELGWMELGWTRSGMDKGMGDGYWVCWQRNTPECVRGEIR